MTIPALRRVGYHARTDHGSDRYVQPPTYSPARDVAGVPVAVIGWAPAGSGPGAQPLGHDREVLEVDLYVPAGFAVGRGDLIDLPSGPAGQFEVDGTPGDYNHGFHDWAPGKVVRLRRVEG